MKSREFKDIRYDAYNYKDNDQEKDNDNDNDKDKDKEKTKTKTKTKVLKRLNICYIFEKAGGTKISNMISLPHNL